MIAKDFTRYCDINFKKITIIVKKMANKQFKYTSLKRNGAGFIIILNGNGFFNYKGRNYKLKRGDILTLDRGSVYCIGAVEDDFEYVTTEFFLDEGQSFKAYEVPVYMSFENDTIFMEKVKALLNIWNERSYHYIIETRILLSDILLEVIKKAATKKMRSTGYDRILPAVNYINKHYNEKIDVEKLARLCMFSQSHFRKLFFKYVGFSPLEYRERVRCDIAKNMLASNIFTVQEIAEALGYCDIYHFSKAFKQQTGLSPTSYKKSLELS